MALTLGPLLVDAGIGPSQALVIRHAYTQEPEETELQGLHADSTRSEILDYTRRHSVDVRRFRRRRRTFDVVESDHMADLRGRLVVGWRSTRTWRMKATTAASYPVIETAGAEPLPFPGFDWLVLSHTQLQAVMREDRYVSWRTALASVFGIYLITDTRDGRHYVGKADGEESICQRWSAYAANCHGGNVELRKLNSSGFRFSLLRVFDPVTPTRAINAAESHFKEALDSRQHGRNRLFVIKSVVGVLIRRLRADSSRHGW